MSADNPADRELALINKVELRIALAASDSKLEALLNTYLPPLLLKLASDSAEVRNKVSACLFTLYLGKQGSTKPLAPK